MATGDHQDALPTPETSRHAGPAGSRLPGGIASSGPEPTPDMYVTVVRRLFEERHRAQRDGTD